MRCLALAFSDGARAGFLQLFELSLIEGAVCLAVMLWFSVPRDIKRFRMLKYGRVLRGPVMMTPTEFNDAQRATERRFVALERLQQLSFRFIGKQAPPPVMGIGFKTTESRSLMRIPASKEAQHIQIIGDTGTGKTQLIMQILRQIRDRGDAAIVYDPATEFVKRFYDGERGDVVLNPLDARCPFWSPANEMERNAEAVTIAASLYQPTSVSIKDEFFYRAPAQIFAHLLKTGPTPHELAAWMADEAELQRRVAGTEMAHYIERNSFSVVRSIDARANTVAVEVENGSTVTYDPRRLRGVNVFREVEREFAVGDRLQLTAPNRDLGVANRDLGTVVRLEQGKISLRMEGKPDRLLTFEIAQFRQFDHGYAVTSHSAQGLTADRVLANFDTDSNHNLINTRLAYVAISRASQEAHVYTNDAETLSLRLASDVSKTAAIQVVSQTGPEQFASSQVPQAAELGVEGPSLSI